MGLCKEERAQALTSAAKKTPFRARTRPRMPSAQSHHPSWANALKTPLQRSPLLILPMLLGLQGCGLIQPQAVYEAVRAQEKAKAVGTPDASRTGLPGYDRYEKEREVLSPSGR